MAQENRVFKREDFKSIPQYLQTQVTLNEQLMMLNQVANRLGLYDAADFVARGLR